MTAVATLLFKCHYIIIMLRTRDTFSGETSRVSRIFPNIYFSVSSASFSFSCHLLARSHCEFYYISRENEIIIFVCDTCLSSKMICHLAKSERLLSSAGVISARQRSSSCTLIRHRWPFFLVIFFAVLYVDTVVETTSEESRVLITEKRRMYRFYDRRFKFNPSAKRCASIFHSAVILYNKSCFKWIDTVQECSWCIQS